MYNSDTTYMKESVCRVRGRLELLREFGQRLQHTGNKWQWIVIYVQYVCMYVCMNFMNVCMYV